MLQAARGGRHTRRVRWTHGSRTRRYADGGRVPARGADRRARPDGYEPQADGYELKADGYESPEADGDEPTPAIRRRRACPGARG